MADPDPAKSVCVCGGGGGASEGLSINVEFCEHNSGSAQKMRFFPLKRGKGSKKHEQCVFFFEKIEF